MTDQVRFHLIGDCHLGRVFKTGVPLNRRGEIEEMFFKAFEEELDNPKGETVVQLGDLFDSPVVPNNVLYRTYEIIEKTTKKHPETTYIFLAGNHDLHRDDKVIPAIRILELLLKGTAKNVKFVIEHTLLLDSDTLIVPWSYIYPLEEVLKGAKEETQYVIGHFEEPLDPAVASSKFKFISGHIHKPHVNNNVIFTGSLLPIAFGEEPDDKIMKTCTLEELKAMPSESLENMRLRVVLKDGETLPEDIDCLQLISKRDGVEDSVQLEVNLEDFDFKELFMKELKESGKGEELWSKYINLKNN